MENNNSVKISKKTNSKKSISQFNGSENVKYFPTRKTDFNLPSQDHVAKYNCDLLNLDWNEKLTTQRLLTKIYKSFAYGLPGRLYTIILQFLVLFYIFHYFRIQHGCVPSKFPSLSTIKNSNSTCPDTDPFEFLKDAEQTFMRVLTWLVGFYVATTARRFWCQVFSLPRMDSTGLMINAQVWSDSKKSEDQIEIIDNMTVKEFKMTISRWMILSWTMLLSRVSPVLQRAFPSPKEYNTKRLLTKEEYNLLQGELSGEDGWLSRWNIPLIWTSKLILQAVKKPKDVNLAFIKEQKDLTAHILKFQNDLRMILNHYSFKTSRMLYQAMTLALYTYFVLGALGGYQDVYGTYDDVPIVVKLLAIFPIYQILKFGLIFSWCLTAKDLQNPFGDDE